MITDEIEADEAMIAAGAKVLADSPLIDGPKLAFPAWMGTARAVYEAVDRAAWRSIETAPKDGTKILAYGFWAGEINGRDEAPSIQIARWTDRRTDYPGFAWDVIGSDAYAAWIKPTHWRPLPSPPRDGSKSMMTDRTAYELAIAEAYRAGVEEMRERAAQCADQVNNNRLYPTGVGFQIAEAIRALPVE